jgi:hypothetical protein
MESAVPSYFSTTGFSTAGLNERGPLLDGKGESAYTPIPDRRGLLINDETG